MKWIKRVLLLMLLSTAVVLGFRIGRALRFTSPGFAGRRVGRRMSDWVRTSVPAARVVGDLKVIRSQNERILNQNERIYVQNDKILAMLESRLGARR